MRGALAKELVPRAFALFEGIVAPKAILSLHLLDFLLNVLDDYLDLFDAIFIRALLLLQLPLTLATAPVAAVHVALQLVAESHGLIRSVEGADSHTVVVRVALVQVANRLVRGSRVHQRA